jgi:hypothetical protein
VLTTQPGGNLKDFMAPFCKAVVAESIRFCNSVNSAKASVTVITAIDFKHLLYIAFITLAQ